MTRRNNFLSGIPRKTKIVLTLFFRNRNELNRLILIRSRLGSWKENFFLRLDSRRLSKAPAALIDLGGNVGEASQRFLKFFGCSLGVYLVEPNAASIDQAKENVAGSNIIYVNKGVSADGKERLLEVPDGAPSNSQGACLKRKDEKSNISSSFVKTMTLEEVLKKSSLYFPGATKIVKMDIEGDEFDVLNSTSDKVLQCFDTIYIEWHVRKFPSSQSKELQRQIKGFRKRCKRLHVSYREWH